MLCGRSIIDRSLFNRSLLVGTNRYNFIFLVDNEQTSVVTVNKPNQ